MSDDTLKIARDLVATRAKLRSMVRRLLTRYGYPPDKREESFKMGTNIIVYALTN